jgi:hypothetical protein
MSDIGGARRAQSGHCWDHMDHHCPWAGEHFKGREKKKRKSLMKKKIRILWQIGERKSRIYYSNIRMTRHK